MQSKILQAGIPAIKDKALFGFNSDQMHMLNYKITSSSDPIKSSLIDLPKLNDNMFSINSSRTACNV